MIKKINRVRTLIFTILGPVMEFDEEKKYIGYKRVNILLYHQICLLCMAILIAAIAKWIFSPGIQIGREGHVLVVFCLLALVGASYISMTSSTLWRKVGWLFGWYGFIGFILITILLTWVYAYISPEVSLGSITIEVFLLLTFITFVVFIFTFYSEWKWEKSLSKRYREGVEKKKEREKLGKTILQTTRPATFKTLKKASIKWYYINKPELNDKNPTQIAKQVLPYLKNNFQEPEKKNEEAEDGWPSSSTIRDWLGFKK